MSRNTSRLRVSSPSRTRTSRSTTPIPYLSQPENLILADGDVGEDTTDLLNDLVHGRSGVNPIFVDTEESGSDHDEELNKRRQLPWWKRPSPIWLLAMMPFSAIAGAATMAPKIEIYTTLACRVHKPEYTINVPLGNPFYEDHHIDSIAPSLIDKSDTLFSLHMDPGARMHFQDEIYEVYIHNGTAKEPTKPNLCASDPVVQAAVAKLSAVMTACMGILSCLTTAWWGSFSDRHGRTSVMGISIVGLLLTDFNFIFVYIYSRSLPGGYWFLIAGPIIEGSLGGMSGAIAAMHAYMADTTDTGSRSRTFSLSLGLLFSGMAIGPTLGGLLIRFTQHTMFVFYVTTAVHCTSALLIWFVIPESLSVAQRQRLKAIQATETRELARNRELNPTTNAIARAKRVFGFLSPLSIFAPQLLESSGNPLKRSKRDWNLTLLVIAYGFSISIMGAYTYKFQYAAATFGWTSETIGYWLSLIGAARAFYLTVTLPIAIKLFKSKSVSNPHEIGETQPLLSSARDGSAQPGTLLSNRTPPLHKERHSSAFDLGLARVSLCFEIITYTLMGLAPTPLAFTLLGMLGSLGIGFSPAVQSVALDLYTRKGGKESGRLFGALSVVQALCSQILGPAVFGFTYMKTVATFPRAIFFLSVSCVTVSFISLSLVRLPKLEARLEARDAEDQADSQSVREVSLVNINEEGEGAR